MEVSKVADKFGEKWIHKMAKFIESESFDNIIRYLKNESGVGKIIYPASGDLFKVFKTTDPDNLRVLIIGYCPYHTPIDQKDKKVGVADGIAFSCSRSTMPQPSLSMFWDGYVEDTKDEFDVKFKYPLDLTYMGSQGIMMYNCELSVEMLKPGSHGKIWEPFTRYFIEEVINPYYSGLTIVLMGKEAQKYEKYIDPLKHYVKKVEHPAAAAYRGDNLWRHDKMFSWCSKIHMDNNKYRIWWEPLGEEPDWVQDKPKKVVQNEDEVIGELPWQKK